MRTLFSVEAEALTDFSDEPGSRARGHDDARATTVLGDISARQAAGEGALLVLMQARSDDTTLAGITMLLERARATRNLYEAHDVRYGELEQVIADRCIRLLAAHPASSSGSDDGDAPMLAFEALRAQMMRAHEELTAEAPGGDLVAAVTARILERNAALVGFFEATNALKALTPNDDVELAHAKLDGARLGANLAQLHLQLFYARLELCADGAAALARGNVSDTLAAACDERELTLDRWQEQIDRMRFQ